MAVWLNGVEFPPAFSLFGSTTDITASTTQTQGQQPLVTSTNRVSTVANDNDVVTLPLARKGRFVEVVNNGVNVLQVFPASGDDAGPGVDQPLFVEANEALNLTAYSNTVWSDHNVAATFHAELSDDGNTDAYVIHQVSKPHCYHTNGLTSLVATGWTFDAGGAGSPKTIDSIADGGGGLIAVTTSAAHGLAAGDIVSITNTGVAAYDAVFVVVGITSSVIFTVTATYSITATGFVDQAATLIAGVSAAGRYQINWHTSMSVGNPNDVIGFQVYRNAAVLTNTSARARFGTSGDVKNISGNGSIDIVDGDRLSFIVQNNTGTANITLRTFTMLIARI